MNNQQYAIWSRLLLETVNIFGQRAKIEITKSKIFYSGVSKMIFNSFIISLTSINFPEPFVPHANFPD